MATRSETKMEVPTPIKESIRQVLESCSTGILIENVFKEYKLRTNLPLPYLQLGFTNVEGLLRAMPDVARLEYSVSDNSMKVYGIQNVNFSVGPPHWRRTGLLDHNRPPLHDRMGGPYQHQMRPPYQNRMGAPYPRMGAPYPKRGAPYPRMGAPYRMESPYQSSLKRKLDNTAQSKTGRFNGPAGGEKGEEKVDRRYMHTLCFPVWQKPIEPTETLEEMFGAAGEVFEVYETNRWIYVCYPEKSSVQRAFEMFKHLDLKKATYSALIMDREFKQKMQIKKEMGIVDPPKPPGYKRRRKGRVIPEGPLVRLKVGNLDPKTQYTVTMFRKLFGAFNISWIKFKVVNIVGKEEPIMFAYVLAMSKADAEGIVKKFNGFVLYGRPLEIEVKEKVPESEKKNPHEASTSKDSSSCTAEDDDQDEEPLKNLQITFTIDRQGSQPGLESTMPGQETSMPGLESSMPGLESSMPGLESAMPRLESSMPGLESALPKLEPSIPGLEPASLLSSLPGVGPIIPKSKPSM